MKKCKKCTYVEIRVKTRIYKCEECGNIARPMKILIKK